MLIGDRSILSRESEVETNRHYEDDEMSLVGEIFVLLTPDAALLRSFRGSDLENSLPEGICDQGVVAAESMYDVTSPEIPTKTGDFSGSTQLTDVAADWCVSTGYLTLFLTITPWASGTNPSGQVVELSAKAPVKFASARSIALRSAPAKVAPMNRARPTSASRRLAPVKSAPSNPPLRIKHLARFARVKRARDALHAGSLAPSRFASSRMAPSSHADRRSEPDKSACRRSCRSSRAR